MTVDLAFVLVLLVAAIAMFVVNRPRMDAVALIMLVALPLTGVISMNEALAGLADPNIVLIAGMFVVGEGLVRTGVARGIGDWMNAAAAGSSIRLLVLLMLAVCGLGAFMSSTAVVAIFIPIVLRIARNARTAPSRLMMPLSVAALISGMTTLVATAPNLVVNAELMRHGASGFGFFSFTPFGVVALAIGVAYMLAARNWLSSRAQRDGGAAERPVLRDWIAQYDLASREHRLRLREGSPLAAAHLGELLQREPGIGVLAIERRSGFRTELLRAAEQTALEPGDVLLVDVLDPTLDVAALRERYALDAMRLDEDAAYFTDRSQELGMVEVILPPDSALIGRTVRAAKVRDQYGLTVIGLRHGSAVTGHGLLDETLKAGDTLLLTGFWSDIRRLQASTADFVLLTVAAELDEVLPAAHRAPFAVAILALVVALMVSGLVPNVQAALIGCLLMGLFGCVDMVSAYRAISWKSLVLIVGMLPFSLALQRTGGVDLAADGLLKLVGGAAPHLVLGSLFVITAVLGLFISNTATAVLMAPVALAIAKDLSASPYPFAMIVALAASTAFMAPISSPVNTLVVGPGNYTFGDFVRIGVPLSLLVLVASVILVPLLLPP
jgi:di/tricarboxylate transporter